MPVSDGMLARIRRRGEQQTQVVYPWELPSIMRRHIFTGAMGTVFFALTSGIYLVAFGTALGLAYWQWGLLSWACSVTIVLQIASAGLVSRTGNRKWLWYTTAMVSRLLRGAALAAAFWLMGPAPTAARWAFILLLVGSSAFGAISAPPWFSWLVDIIPEETHGRFWGRRSAWIALANVLLVVPLGLALDRTPEAGKVHLLMAIFGFAFLVGLMDLVIHRTIPEPPMQQPRRKRFWHEVAVPIRDHTFRPWLVFNACWMFSMTLGGSLATIYFVQDLGIRENFMGGSLVLIVAPLLATMVGGRLLGILLDRYGVRLTLSWAHRCWAMLPLFWLLATPQTALWWLGAAALMGGLASVSAGNASGKLITRLPESPEVPMYVAVSTCVGSLAGGMGPLVAGLLLHALEGVQWTVGARALGGFHLLFALSLLLRNASVLILRRIHEPRGAPVPQRQPVGRHAQAVRSHDG